MFSSLNLQTTQAPGLSCHTAGVITQPRHLLHKSGLCSPTLSPSHPGTLVPWHHEGTAPELQSSTDKVRLRQSVSGLFRMKETNLPCPTHLHPPNIENCFSLSSSLSLSVNCTFTTSNLLIDLMLMFAACRMSQVTFHYR